MPSFGDVVGILLSLVPSRSSRFVLANQFTLLVGFVPPTDKAYVPLSVVLCRRCSLDFYSIEHAHVSQDEGRVWAH